MAGQLVEVGPDSGPLPGAMSWQQDRVWQALVSELAEFPGSLRVLEVCGGLSSGTIALAALLGRNKVSLVGFYDTDPELRPALAVTHGSSAVLHVGASGNILRYTAPQFPDCDIFVAGPPCPPWASMGKRKSFDDKRAGVFWRAVDIVVHQGQRGQLMFFVFENVEGILKTPAGAAEAPVKTIVAELQQGLPNFIVEVTSANTMDFGLPQRRPRVYIVGRRTALFSRGAPPAARPFASTVPLGALLRDTRAGPVRLYTPTQRENIADFKRASHRMMASAEFSGQIVAVDVSRTPSGRTAWAAQAVRPGVVECLTASGPTLHVFSLGEGTGQLTVDRPLVQRERGLLQGFPEAVCSVSVPEVVAKRMFGNAMSIPVIGSVLARELAALLRTHGALGVAALLRDSRGEVFC